MPYRLSDNGLCVVKDDGTTVKCHDTHEQAMAHMRALMANVPDATKSGARHSRTDQEHIDQALDHIIAAGGMHPRLMAENAGELFQAIDTEKALVFVGGEVKALGDGRIGGQLVRVTSRGDYDLTGDRFDTDTDFGPFQQVPVFYNHAQDAVLGKRVLSTARLTRNDAGVWAETQLALRDEYEREIYKLAEAGKLGWSSGTAAHLVERRPEGKGYAIKSWPIVEASLTPTPAEFRNSAVTLKSWISGQAGQPEPDGSPLADKNVSIVGVKTMSEQVLQISPELKARLEWLEAQEQKRIKDAEAAERQREIDTKARAMAEEFVKDALKKAGIPDKVDPAKHAENDEGTKDLRKRAEYKAVFSKWLRGQASASEMKALNEGTDSAGGFLVPEDLQAGIIAKLPGLTALWRLVQKVPTSRDTVTFKKRQYTTNNTYTAAARLTWTGEIPASATAARITSNVYQDVRVPVYTGMSTEIVYRDLLEDNAYNVEGDLTRVFAENIGQDLEYYWAQGTGVNQPEGITVNGTLRTGATVTGSAATLGTVDSLKNCMFAVPAQYRRQGVWVFNSATLLTISKFKDGNNRYLFEMEDRYGGGIGSSEQAVGDGRLLGKPFYISEQFPSEAANAYIAVFGDLTGYKAPERVGMSIARLDELYAETNAVAFVLRVRVGGQVVEDYKMELLKCST